MQSSISLAALYSVWISSHRLEGAIFVELGRDLLPHVGENRGEHDEGAGTSHTEGVSESSGEGGLVEVQSLSPLVHDEEHF